MTNNSSFLHNSYFHHPLGRALHPVIIMVVALLTAMTTYAFDESKYASSSVLSSGRWIKISVPESGLYAITPQQLRQWGFSDASQVRVCGYGGARIADLMTEANYIDDLPVIPTLTTAGGNIVFYGVGPEQWSSSITGRFSRTSNIYSSKGYYFVTQVESSDSILSQPEIKKSGTPSATNPATTYWHRLQHEQDLTSPGKAGPQLVGEDFRISPSREFKFDLVDRDDSGTDVWFETSFVAKTFTQASTISFTVNGNQLAPANTDRISATVNDSHNHGSEVITRRTLSDIEGNALNIKITHSSPVTVRGAWLNYISVNYVRQLKLPTAGFLNFWTNNAALSLSNATASTRVLDVTDPTNIIEVNISEISADASRTWTSSYSGWRTYVAFNDNAALPSPTFEGAVANQNLHDVTPESVPHMVILCHRSMKSQAQRIAALHATDTFEPLQTLVVDIEQVYNEFSSGMADVSGIRKYFKMLWDKGAYEAGDGYSSRFRYAILLGRTTYDSRLVTDEAKAFVSFIIPTWMGGTMRQSLNDTDGYGTDDFMAFLEDNSGSDKGLDNLCIAIGRIPARSVSDAANYIDKLEQYMSSTKKTSWKNNVMFLADDGDDGRHMDQSESFIRNMSSIPDNPLFINKVYLDAYLRESNAYPLAREAMFRHLNDGVVWWSFIGHANDHALTHNDQLTYNDLNNMVYKNIPVFYAATCDFLRWDQNSLSGGEIMFYERNGGAISLISATRPVYIYENGLLSNAFGRQLGARDSQGKLLTVGEIYRRAKNNILTDGGSHLSNPNRLKFVLMGDPAMRLATPSNMVDIAEINNKPLSSHDDDPIELNALQTASVKGYIRTPDGNLYSDFNGVVTITLYDAEFSTTTHGYPDAGTEGRQITFEQQGSRLTAVSTPVTNGEFEVKLTVPTDISDNYRPAAIVAYAYSLTGDDDAVGKTNNLYVYGYDSDAMTDDVPPVIESIYLNHSSFTDGGVTDSSPLLIAKVSDDVAINLSTAGIGHSITAQLDGTSTFTDVSLYYTPVSDGTNGGVINYPLSSLTPGNHTLTLRVWDTSANSATATINFSVDERLAPKIFDIYTDANPAHDKANFYLTHDRPEQMATVSVEVFNMLGHPIWSRTSTGVSDMFTSSPVTWDLTDSAGRRVSRGIYLYRATITVDGETFDTGSRRIAVAAY
ncbi:MAG: type IX secretion system sortase PorU [Muribaculaceae bacterium]|nr:type IX secretion system sortase PorU [Muribaculaceae bacterium]